MSNEKETIKKVSIICSKGSLEGIYPPLIMANGACLEGIDCSVFFTFFGMDAITKNKMGKIKVATVGNPALGIPTLLGAIPGMSAMATTMMSKKMEKLDIPGVPDFIEMIHDAGAKLYACKASVEMFGLTMDDFCSQVEKILTVGDFYQMSDGAEIIFT